MHQRQKRYALKEDIAKYGRFVGYLNPARPGEMLMSYGDVAYRCDDFDFLACISKN
jgi:hypothetical protein